MAKYRKGAPGGLPDRDNRPPRFYRIEVMQDAVRELRRTPLWRSSQNASHEKFAGVTLHAISKENFIRYPAGRRLRILESVNGSELRFRARLCEGCTPRLEETRGQGWSMNFPITAFATQTRATDAG
jgi:hypothetical protein